MKKVALAGLIFADIIMFLSLIFAFIVISNLDDKYIQLETRISNIERFIYIEE
jgi:hypothetical protein